MNVWRQPSGNTFALSSNQRTAPSTRPRRTTTTPISSLVLRSTAPPVPAITGCDIRQPYAWSAYLGQRKATTSRKGAIRLLVAGQRPQLPYRLHIGQPLECSCGLFELAQR